MSSNNVFLTVSVVLNLILLALFWSTLSDSNKGAADLAQFKADVQARDKTVKELQTGMTNIQDKLGVSATDIGTEDDAEEGTLMYKLNDIIKRGQETTQAERSIDTAMSKMKNEFDNQAFLLQQRKDENVAQVQRFDNMVKEKNGEVQKHDDAKTKAENQLNKNVKEHQEAIAAKDQTIADVRTSLSDTQAEFAKFRTESDRQISDLTDRVSRLSSTVVRLKRQIFEREDLSFEVADGKITFVDSARQIVSINLGKADGLRPGITFSVYQKDNSGIGRRNTEDIKGKIEITNILGPHRAEARILGAGRAVKTRSNEEQRNTFARRSNYYQASLLRPIAQGDPIYSPAFSRGTQELFSLVGLIDTDGDGKSDRELVRNLIRSAGGGIDNEIGDEGEEIVRNEISHKTRFLVIANLGDQDKTDDTRKKAAYQKIQAGAEKLRKEALDSGIRIVSLRAFLDYLGFSAPSGPWRAGEDYPTTLSAGAASDGTSGGLGRRQSQGNVSGLFHPEKRRVYNLRDRLGREGGSGNTSDLYNKGKGGQ